MRSMLALGVFGLLSACGTQDNAPVDTGDSSSGGTMDQTTTGKTTQVTSGTAQPTNSSATSGTAGSTSSSSSMLSSAGGSSSTMSASDESTSGDSSSAETTGSSFTSDVTNTSATNVTGTSDGESSQPDDTSSDDSAEGDPNAFYPCEAANPDEYDVVATKNGATWNVVKGAQQVYSGADFQAALSGAYGALTQGRTKKETILVVGDGELGASIQLAIPSYTVLNVCGTVNVTGTPSGSDRSPFYARNASNIDIPNLKLTGSPQYGLFFRQTNNVHLGQIELRLTRQAGIGIRVDSGPNAGSTTDFNTDLTIDRVYGTGMGSHIVETYGIDKIKIGTIEGEDVGECGLLLNRSTNVEVDSVTCTDCATGTGYAAFRVANSVGKIGNDFPAGNIHVGRVTARGGGRGIFSVSGCGGLVIDEIDIANTGNTSILMQNTYNTVIAAKSGVVSGGLVQLTNDNNNTNLSGNAANGGYPPSKDVTIQNLTLTNGASVRQDWCAEVGRNGSRALNITGGNVSMCN